MFSIGLPVLPIKLTIGKEKKEDAPAAVATPVPAPAATSLPALDNGHIAVMCVTTIAIIAIIAILIIAMRQGGIGKL